MSLQSYAISGPHDRQETPMHEPTPTTFPRCLPFPDHDRPRALPPSRAARPWEYFFKDNDRRDDGPEPIDEQKARAALPWLFRDPVSQEPVRDEAAA